MQKLINEATVDRPDDVFDAVPTGHHHSVQTASLAAKRFYGSEDTTKELNKEPDIAPEQKKAKIKDRFELIQTPQETKRSQNARSSELSNSSAAKSVTSEHNSDVEADRYIYHHKRSAGGSKSSPMDESPTPTNNWVAGYANNLAKRQNNNSKSLKGSEYVHTLVPKKKIKPMTAEASFHNATDRAVMKALHDTASLRRNDKNSSSVVANSTNYVPQGSARVRVEIDPVTGRVKSHVDYDSENEPISDDDEGDRELGDSDTFSSENDDS